MARSVFSATRGDAAFASWLVVATLLLATALSVAAFIALDRPRVGHSAVLHSEWLSGPTRTERGFAKLEQTDRL